MKQLRDLGLLPEVKKTMEDIYSSEGMCLPALEKVAFGLRLHSTLERELKALFVATSSDSSK